MIAILLNNFDFLTQKIDQRFIVGHFICAFYTLFSQIS